MVIDFKEGKQTATVREREESTTKPLMLLPNSIPQGVILLDLVWIHESYGFDAKTISGLKYLLVDDLHEDMKFPETLEHLFVCRNTKGLAYPKVRNLYIHAGWTQNTSPDFGEHYLFYFNGPICTYRLESEVYESIGEQHVIETPAGSKYTVIKRGPKKPVVQRSPDAELTAQLDALEMALGQVAESLRLARE